MIGYDSTWHRDVGYGVPAFCDHPRCNVEIDRGLAYRCGEGRRVGCGLFFCYADLDHEQLCSRCRNRKPAFDPKPDHPRWVKHKLTDESWAEWRAENPEVVATLKTLSEAVK